jgi:hypothetical protein
MSSPSSFRGPPKRTAVAAGAVGVVAAILLLCGTWARADGSGAGGGALKGKVIVSDTEFGTGYGSDAELLKAVRKQGRSSIKSAGNNAWTLNLMVFLKEAPGATSLNIVYYDVSVKPRDQVNFSEVQVQSTQRIVQVNGVAISKDLGFVKGHKYDVLATRLIGGKEKVYARGTVTLK